MAAHTPSRRRSQQAATPKRDDAPGLPARRLDDSMSQAVHVRYERDTQRAIDAGVFGAPSYVVDGEIFWGQDRLDFLQRRLAKG